MRATFRVAAAASFLSIVVLLAPPAGATLHVIDQVSTSFVPADRTISEGDTVRWVWSGGSHTVTSGTGTADPNVGSLFDASLDTGNPAFEYVFDTAGVYPYFCRPHELLGMEGTITVDVASSVRRPVASVAALHRNLPNPFGGETEIAYTLAQASDVRLDVFDARGRRVATLDRGFRGAGTHRVAWNGAGLDGRDSPAGVYFYRLRVGATVQTRKLVLIR